MFCPKCGNKLEEIAKFCGRCGYKLEKGEKEASITIDEKKSKKMEDTQLIEEKSKIDKKYYQPPIAGIFIIIVGFYEVLWTIITSEFGNSITMLQLIFMLISLFGIMTGFQLTKGREWVRGIFISIIFLMQLIPYTIWSEPGPILYLILDSVALVLLFRSKDIFDKIKKKDNK